MTPEQQRWLARAKELTARLQRRLVALEVDQNLDLALSAHFGTLLDVPGWDGELLDVFLR